MFGRLLTAVLALFLVAQPLAAAPAPAVSPNAGGAAPSAPRPGAVPPGLGKAGPSATEGKLDWFTVAGNAFVPEANTSWSAASENNGCLSDPGGGLWTASINIPDGSIIEQTWVGFYNHNATGGPGVVALVSYAISGTTNSLVVFGAAPPPIANVGPFGFLRDGTNGPLDITIDNSQNAYVFSWLSTGAAQDLCYMSIAYQPPPVFGSLLPAVEK
jgi:hypothetical protein